jgi:hypothetical protein
VGPCQAGPRLRPQSVQRVVLDRPGVLPVRQLQDKLFDEQPLTPERRTRDHQDDEQKRMYCSAPREPSQSPYVPVVLPLLPQSPPGAGGRAFS